MVMRGVCKHAYGDAIVIRIAGVLVLRADGSDREPSRQVFPGFWIIERILAARLRD
jgi:hypothetical protein